MQRVQDLAVLPDEFAQIGADDRHHCPVTFDIHVDVTVQVGDIHRIALGKDQRADSCALGGEDLCANAAHGKNPAAEGQFSGQGDIAPRRPLSQ